MTSGDLAAALSAYGAVAASKFGVAGGEPEDQLRAPFDRLLTDVANLLGVPDVVASGEHRLADERIRPDFAIHVRGALVGFVEIKAPGKGADPGRFRGHDKQQWERLSCLPNVLYTDGEAFALYRDGERVGEIVRLSGPVTTAGAALSVESPDAFLALFDNFLRWQPIAPRRPRELAEAVARLCRFLRAEVTELLVTDQGLQALADDWRRLLFPSLSDAEFADAYAQTVSFGLLLARVEGVELANRELHDIAADLGRRHTLVGRALDILTDEQVLSKLAVSVTTLQRVLSVVDWQAISRGKDAAWLYFYEDFLDSYDPALRRATGSYYTPVEVVDSMVRMVDELLRSRLGHPDGLASDGVEVVDPGTGSGTFLVRIIEQIAARVAETQGAGAVAARVDAAADRLVGFELQAGPYSVAELRLTAEFARHGVAVGERLRLFLADTLSNPFEAQQNLGAQYIPIARSRTNANKVKAEEQVVVVIGNPPYRERSRGTGGWIEAGAVAAGQLAPLADFIPPKTWGLGTHVKHLYNPYVYFWRWGTWKVFDGNPGDRGVVAFITVAGFLSGPGFAKMRDYLRRVADKLWVIDCSPEGHQPEVSTRVFQGVQQPVCILIALKDGSTDAATPAPVHFTSVTGHRNDKFEQLAALQLDGPAWLAGATEWTAPLRPAMAQVWSSYPGIDDLLAWSGSGTMPGRTWVVAPDPEVLRRRWAALLAAPADEKRALFDEHASDRKIETVLTDNLPGYPTAGAIASETHGCPPPVRYGYRSFDRQWIIPDKRVINRPNPGLWQVRRAREQLFLTLLGDRAPSSGPAMTATALVPDIHHYHGRGGRTFPLWLDATGTVPNVLPGLLDLLADHYGSGVTGPDVFAYLAAVLASPAFLSKHADDLGMPGLRLPLTADGGLFREAVDVGERVLWLQTYGECFSDPTKGRPPQVPQLSADRRPLVVAPIPHDAGRMPDVIEYDPLTRTLHVGDGRVAPVERSVWEYEVSGMRVVKRWFDRRKKDPDGRRSSALDAIHVERWPAAWTTELLELLQVVAYLIDEEPRQAELLERIEAGPLITMADLARAGLLPAAARPTVEKPPRPGRLPGF